MPNSASGRVGHFDVREFALDSGEVLPRARLVYQRFGTLDADGSNLVVLPTYYTGTHSDNARWIGPGRVLDPARWCIVIPNMLGNGVSSSPSNTPSPHGAAAFPHISLIDNVRLQYKMVRTVFGVDSIRMVAGWSMGGMQAYQWAALYPAMVQTMLCVCGAARCSPHNRVFLEGVKAALCADADFADGHYTRPPERGLRAFARVYAGWAYSQAFFRERLHAERGLPEAEDLLARWEDDHLALDANDLLCMLHTWQSADLALTPGTGDFPTALSRIAARAIVMPCRSDLYFTPEDNAAEVRHLRRGELRIIDSPWGHIAGGPGRVAEGQRMVDIAMRDLLEG